MERKSLPAVASARKASSRILDWFRSAWAKRTLSCQVDVYSRQGCHLCDDAVDILKKYGLRPRVVDIDAEPELAERFTNCVPVVLIDGREYFRGRINEVMLRRVLKNYSAKRTPSPPPPNA